MISANRSKAAKELPDFSRAEAWAYFKISREKKRDGGKLQRRKMFGNSREFIKLAQYVYSDTQKLRDDSSR